MPLRSIMFLSHHKFILPSGESEDEKVVSVLLCGSKIKPEVSLLQVSHQHFNHDLN